VERNKNTSKYGLGKRKTWPISNNYSGIFLVELRKDIESLRNVTGTPTSIKPGSFRIRSWWAHHSIPMSVMIIKMKTSQSLVLQPSSGILENKTNPYGSG
jgi:hypothetical protein